MKILKKVVGGVVLALSCFVTDVSCAQVNIGARVYRYGVHRWHAGGIILRTRALRNHLAGLPVVNVLGELARMLLAQIPPAIPPALGVNHNVVNNNNAGYAGPHAGDVHRACSELKTHLLEEGHLGYFPMFSTRDQNRPFNHLFKINKIVSRGIFRVRPNIMQRTVLAQRRILNWINAYPVNGNDWRFFSYLPNYMRNLGFCVDPCIPLPGGLPVNIVNALNIIIPRQPLPVPGGGLNLETFTNQMIDGLLTANPANLAVGQLQYNGNFPIDVTYHHNLGNPIGINASANPTNTIRIVVGVFNGVVRVVTMFPI